MGRREWANDNPFNETIEPGALPELNLADVDGMGFDNLSLPILRHEDGNVYFGDRFILSATGVLIANEVTRTELWAFFEGAKKLNTAIQWVIGDILFFAENQFNLSYGDIAGKTGYTARTIEQYIYVMRNVSIRVENLKFKHHAIVAALEDDEQVYWLELAEAKDWSAREMERQIKGEKRPAVDLIADKTYRNAMNRVWRNVQGGIREKIKDNDLDALESWIKEVQSKWP